MTSSQDTAISSNLLPAMHSLVSSTGVANMNIAIAQ